MRLYKILDRMFPSSYAAKFSLVAFLSSSIPVLLVSAFLAVTEGVDAIASPVLLVLAGSCLVAAMLNAMVATALTGPLDLLRQTLGSLHRQRVYRPLPNRFCDELGLAMQLGNRLAEDLGARLHNDLVKDTTDPLTGALYRAPFERAMEEAETGSVLALFLKDYTDLRKTQGEEQTDRAMAALGRVLKQATRQGDLVCLYDEGAFCVFLNGAGREVARHVAERIRSGAVHALMETLTDARLQAGLAVRGNLEPSDVLWARAHEAVAEAAEIAPDRVLVARVRN